MTTKNVKQKNLNLLPFSSTQQVAPYWPKKSITLNYCYVATYQPKLRRNNVIISSFEIEKRARAVFSQTTIKK